MKKRFLYELIVGIILLISIFKFGQSGMVVMVLIAAQPFIGKRKLDEREYQLFYKVGNYTAGIMLLACFIIYYSSDYVLNGQLIEKNWLPFVLSTFILAHGASGLIIFKKN